MTGDRAVQPGGIFNELRRIRWNTDLPLAVMFIDLDHFKEINDTHGHQAGDQILTQAAQRILHVVAAVGHRQPLRRR